MPKEYYCLLPKEFHLMTEGYFNKRYNNSCEVRYSAFISILPFTKDLNYQKFCGEVWPLAGDKNTEERREKIEEVPVIDAELWEQLQKQMAPRKTEYEKIMERHKINLKPNG